MMTLNFVLEYADAKTSGHFTYAMHIFHLNSKAHRV